MRLYSLRSMFPVIVGIPIMHLLVVSLCAFFTQRFLMETYDPIVIVLLIAFLGPVLYVDFALYHLQIYHRCFLRFKADETGIRCYGIGVKSWRILWNEIRMFGITGYDTKNQPYALIFFSKKGQEDTGIKQKVQINNDRIVIQVRHEVLTVLNQYMPKDIKKRIATSVEQKSDFFYRRRDGRTD